MLFSSVHTKPHILCTNKNDKRFDCTDIREWIWLIWDIYPFNPSNLNPIITITCSCHWCCYFLILHSIAKGKKKTTKNNQQFNHPFDDLTKYLLNATCIRFAIRYDAISLSIQNVIWILCMWIVAHKVCNYQTLFLSIKISIHYSSGSYVLQSPTEFKISFIHVTHTKTN